VKVRRSFRTSDDGQNRESVLLAANGTVLEQHEGDVLVTGAIDAVREIARCLRDSDCYQCQKIRLSDFDSECSATSANRQDLKTAPIAKNEAPKFLPSPP
jgi:hypothetical protein